MLLLVDVFVVPSHGRRPTTFFGLRFAIVKTVVEQLRQTTLVGLA